MVPPKFWDIFCCRFTNLKQYTVTDAQASWYFDTKESLRFTAQSFFVFSLTAFCVIVISRVEE